MPWRKLDDVAARTATVHRLCSSNVAVVDAVNVDVDARMRRDSANSRLNSAVSVRLTC